MCLVAAGALAQSTTRVSVDSQGAQANGESRAAAISADGRWIAFKSLSSNLVPGDANALGDVFVHDRHTGNTSRASLDSAGHEANGESFSPSLSLDGRWIAFQSAATNLVAGDANGRHDVFVRDRVTGTTVIVSVDSVGVLGNGDSDSPSISSDGGRVAFRSRASNLVAGDGNGSADVFVYDFASGAPVLAGAGSNGDSGPPSLSGDGRWVAFASLATNLVPGDTNGVRDVFVHDLATGTTYRASISSASIQANGASDAPSISRDGRFVAFESLAGNLTAGDGNGVSDVFLRDLVAGSTALASSPSGSSQSNGASSEANLSVDGRFVSFTSAANNLVPGDNNAHDDIFVVDIVADTIELESLGANGLPGNGHNRASSLSAGGRRAAFKSDATDLVAGDSNSVADIFLRDTPPATIHVDVQAPPGGDGSAAAPFDRIQDAITDPATIDLDTLSIQPGTYPENLDLSGKSLALHGAAGAGSTLVDGQFQDSVLRIESGEGLGTRAEGLTLLHGYSIGGTWNYGSAGGGVRAIGSTLTLQGCVVESCFADEKGAGVFAALGSVTMIACELRDNNGIASPFYAAYLTGGGACFDQATILVDQCSFAGNRANQGGGADVRSCTGRISASTFRANITEQGEGGGAYLEASVGSLAVVDSVFEYNDGGHGENYGGGAYASGVQFLNCVFHDNYAEYEGGGLHSSNCSLETCHFFRNKSGTGGALFAYSVSAVDCLIEFNRAEVILPQNWFGLGAGFYGAGLLDHCVIRHNECASSPYSGPGSNTWGGYCGGVLSSGLGPLVLEACTVVGNGAGDGGGVSGAVVHDSIIWGNTPTDVDASTTASWSDVGQPLHGPGNLSVDPSLWNPGGDAHLSLGSPCIDAGDPASPADPDGSRADMGAIPFEQFHLGEAGEYCVAKINSQNCRPFAAVDGDTSLSGADDLTIAAGVVLENKSGILFWGIAPASAPFLGGILCVHPPILRTQVQNSGGFTGFSCSGTYSYLFSHSYMQTHLLGAGSTVYAQYWSRDPGFTPPDNVGLTDAVVFEIWP